MSWSCRRPGCNRPAVAAIHYDPVSCQVWLDPVAADDRSGQALCSEHIERLRPPRGWVVVDRLGVQTHLVTAPSTAEPRTVPARHPRRKWGEFDTPTLEFTADPRPTEPHGATSPGHLTDVARPAEPDLPDDLDRHADVPEATDATVGDDPEGDDATDRDDLAPLFAPTGRLLSRAFASRGPQRSILTADLPDDPSSG